MLLFTVTACRRDVLSARPGVIRTLHESALCKAGAKMRWPIETADWLCGSFGSQLIFANRWFPGFVTRLGHLLAMISPEKEKGYS